MCRVWPWVAALVALAALWPVECGAADGGTTSCRRTILLPLSWGEAAGTWGMATAFAVAVVAFFVTRRLRQRFGPRCG